MVTSTPKDRQAEANSQPITPPPSTMADSGSRSRPMAWSLVRMRWPSISSPGRVRAYEPDASTRCGASYTSPATSIPGRPSGPATNRPSPGMMVMLREAISPDRPL